jgi:hypothetical protein
VKKLVGAAVVLATVAWASSWVPDTLGGAAQLTLETKLVPEKDAGDGFGASVSLDGDTVVAGAFGNNAEGVASGAAYVFKRQSGGWVEEAKLVPDDAEAFDFFGTSVSLFADRALIGSIGDDDDGPASGSAYVFERLVADGSAWTETAKLTASDAATSDVFGSAVALDGDVAVIGAPRVDDDGEDSGAAYVFRFDGSDWIEEAKLTASDAQPLDSFGSAVAVSGDVVVIGAFLDDDDGLDSGSAYVFGYDGTVWTERAKLKASDGDAGKLFGASVAVDGETIAVGGQFAPGSSIYVFGPDGGGWTELQKLTVAEGIGFAVSISGDMIAAGAFLDDEAAQGAGAAYVFRLSGSTWVQDQKLVASDAEAFDRFGFAVSTDGAGVAVGADLDDDSGPNAGAAYVFEADTTAEPPVADAGDDSVTECASPEGAVVALDGSGSTDPGESILRFEWFEDFGLPSETFLGEGETLEVNLPLGSHVITLRVTNDAGLDDVDEVVAAVVDTTPPVLSVEVHPRSLWPPNHRLVPITAVVHATDACGTPSVVLESIRSSEPDDAPGSGHTAPDIRGARIGTADFEFLLRAERAGPESGRVYAITYAAADESGNDVSADAAVRVPKSQGRGRPTFAKRDP